MPADLERLRAAGLSDEAVVQAVTIAAYFNYVTRIADATGIEFDYGSPLPRLAADRQKQPIERPPPQEWPKPGGSAFTLVLRPNTAAALERWRTFMFERAEPLAARDRAVALRAAAWNCCDAAGVEAWPDAEPRTERERIVTAYASKLTLAPWQMGGADVASLRAQGFDDRTVLNLISLVALQNVLSRVRLALG